MTLTLDWHDLTFNGTYAWLRAMEAIQKELATVGNQQALLAHRLDQINASHRVLVDQLDLPSLLTRLADLEYLISEELLLGLVQPAQIREVVEELGNGWRIERQPAEPNVSAATSAQPPANPAQPTTADAWLQYGCVTRYTAAVEGD